MKISIIKYSVLLCLLITLQISYINNSQLKTKTNSKTESSSKATVKASTSVTSSSTSTSTVTSKTNTSTSTKTNASRIGNSPFEFNDDDFDSFETKEANQVENDDEQVSSSNNNNEVNFVQKRDNKIINPPKTPITTEDRQKYNSFRKEISSNLQKTKTFKPSMGEIMADRFSKFKEKTKNNIQTESVDDFVAFMGYLSDVSHKVNKKFDDRRNQKLLRK